MPELRELALKMLRHHRSLYVFSRAEAESRFEQDYFPRGMFKNRRSRAPIAVDAIKSIVFVFVQNSKKL
jgi:hypothetical protein